MYKEQQEAVASGSATVAKTAQDAAPELLKSPTNNDNSDEEDEPSPVVPEDDNDVGVVGHLRERAQQMDWRTDRMAKKWYLEFCDVRRQGSFLPQKMTHQQQAAWEELHEQQASSKRGTGWTHLSFGEVRFLHWIGFAPSGSTASEGTHGVQHLPPPDPQTTHALAFLAHDFFGRIVEKSIGGRKEIEHEQQEKKQKNEPLVILQELDQHEQLTQDNVERALQQHADLQATPMFSSGSSNNDPKTTQKKKSMAQLYFGPGFEDRVEMEMEELMRQEQVLDQQQHKAQGANPTTDEEDDDLKWRQQEDELFGQLVAQGPGTEQDLLNLSPAATPPTTRKSKRVRGARSKTSVDE
mmetsp:Transcript_21473/g.44794  ORF Transcript_21473/g.44794 Transcript_21473/m.44794 type:complete len:353 (-) Transcript_21473:226-1284(-)